MIQITQRDFERLVELATRSHDYCDGDSWYSCPKAPEGCSDDSQGDGCNCGADRINKEVQEIADRVYLQKSIYERYQVIDTHFVALPMR